MKSLTSKVTSSEKSNLEDLEKRINNLKQNFKAIGNKYGSVLRRSNKEILNKKKQKKNKKTKKKIKKNMFKFNKPKA